MNNTPRLARIEDYSTWLISDSQTVARNVRELATVPNFETRAEDAMHRARDRLKEALATIETAITDYAAKPVA